MVYSHHKLTATIFNLYVPGFGASASLDDSSSSQNGYPKNRHLKEAHQTLDNNLGKKNKKKKTFLLNLFVFLLDE